MTVEAGAANAAIRQRTNKRRTCMRHYGGRVGTVQAGRRQLDRDSLIDMGKVINDSAALTTARDLLRYCEAEHEWVLDTIMAVARLGSPTTEQTAQDQYARYNQLRAEASTKTRPGAVSRT